MLAALVIDGTFAACPFCKGRRVRIHYASHLYRAVCLTPGCEAHGPRNYDPDEALEAWNAGRPMIEPK